MIEFQAPDHLRNVVRINFLKTFASPCRSIWVTHSSATPYSQMKLQMKREALEKINRQANEQQSSDTVNVQ
jgi:hypothetical protein